MGVLVGGRGGGTWHEQANSSKPLLANGGFISNVNDKCKGEWVLSEGCLLGGSGGDSGDGVPHLLGDARQALGHVLVQLGGLGVLVDLGLDGVGDVLSGRKAHNQSLIKISICGIQIHPKTTTRSSSF